MTPKARDPSWPPMETLDPDRFDATYDHLSDTLFLDFFDHARPAVSVPAADSDREHLFALVAMETGEVVGVQVEDFRVLALRRHPAWKHVLDEANTHASGVTEADRARRHADLARFVNDVVTLAASDSNASA